MSTSFDTRQLTDLPVLDRNFTKFILLTPGTQQLGWQHAASENPQGSTQTMVNGQHFSGTGYQLDGTENRDPILGIIVVNPTLESIAETKITSQNYDAEFGQATAGVVSVQTKSGGNQLRGSGFWFHQNESLQARNPVHPVPARPADRAVPARHQQEPVRRLRRRQDRREPVVLLRRLRRHAEHGRGFPSGDRADTRRARRRLQRLWRQHLRSRRRRARRAAAVCQQRHSERAAVAAGAGALAAHPGAERGGARERDDRELRRIGLRDLRRQRPERAHRRPSARRHQHLRPLQSRRLPARRPAGLRRERRRRRARQPRWRVRCPQSKPRLRPRLGALADLAR